MLLRVPFVELLFGEFSGIEGSEGYQRDISVENHTRKGLGRLTGGDGNGRCYLRAMELIVGVDELSSGEFVGVLWGHVGHCSTVSPQESETALRWNGEYLNTWKMTGPCMEQGESPRPR